MRAFHNPDGAIPAELYLERTGSIHHAKEEAAKAPHVDPPIDWRLVDSMSDSAIVQLRCTIGHGAMLRSSLGKPEDVAAGFDGIEDLSSRPKVHEHGRGAAPSVSCAAIHHHVLQFNVAMGQTRRMHRRDGIDHLSKQLQKFHVLVRSSSGRLAGAIARIIIQQSSVSNVISQTGLQKGKQHVTYRDTRHIAAGIKLESQQRHEVAMVQTPMNTGLLPTGLNQLGIAAVDPFECILERMGIACAGVGIVRLKDEGESTLGHLPADPDLSAVVKGEGFAGEGMAGGGSIGAAKAEETDGSNAKDAEEGIDQAQDQANYGFKQLLDHNYHRTEDAKQIQAEVIVIWIGVSSGRGVAKLRITNVHRLGTWQTKRLLDSFVSAAIGGVSACCASFDTRLDLIHNISR